MFGVLSPFALCRGHGVSAAEGGNAHALRGRNLASSGEPLYRRKVCRHPTVKRKERSSPAAAGRRIGGTACRQQTVKRKKTSAEGIRKGSLLSREPSFLVLHQRTLRIFGITPQPLRKRRRYGRTR